MHECNACMCVYTEGYMHAFLLVCACVALCARACVLSHLSLYSCVFPLQPEPLLHPVTLGRFSSAGVCVRGGGYMLLPTVHIVKWSDDRAPRYVHTSQGHSKFYPLFKMPFVPTTNTHRHKPTHNAKHDTQRHTPTHTYTHRHTTTQTNAQRQTRHTTTHTYTQRHTPTHTDTQRHTHRS